MYCKHCMKQLEDGSAYCSACGRPQGEVRIGFDQNATMPPKKKPIFKRWWFWVIIVAVLLVSCVGASGDSESHQDTNQPSANVGDTTNEDPVSVPKNNEDISIAESVLYDEGGVRITVKGIEDAFTGTDVKLLVENSSQENIAVGCTDFVVNGITMTGYLYIDVAAGKKSNGEISFYNTDMMAAGIDQIATITSFEAYISNTDTYMKTKDISFEITTSAAGSHVQQIDDSGAILYDQNGITVIAKGLTDDFMGGTATVLIKNNTGNDILVQADNVSVNGYTITTLHSDAVCDGTVRFSNIDIYQTDLEENGIEDIADITFDLTILNPKTFETLTQTGELRMSSVG